MAKTASIDSRYIDYKAGTVGVRVWQDMCRPIILERGRWTEYGVSYVIPVEDRDLEATSTALSSLASNLARVEQSDAENARREELRKAITGQIAFETSR